MLIDLLREIFKERPADKSVVSQPSNSLKEDTPNTLLPEFIVVTPPYFKGSAGNTLMHDLCHQLCVNGYKAHIIFVNTLADPWVYFYEKSSQGYNPDLLHTEIADENHTEQIQRVIKSGIVIYPELITGNPLKANNVVRYFLNFDGAISGSKSEYDESDYIITFSKIFKEDYNDLLCKPITNPSFNSDGCRPYAERTLDITYIGKGASFCDCYVIDGSVEITRTWPQTKAELATLLKQTRYFYSWDNISSTNLDALLCGAAVVLLQDVQINRNQLKYSKNIFGTSPFFYGELVNKKVVISANDAFETDLDSFKLEMNQAAESWCQNVDEAAKKMLTFFQERYVNR